MQAIKQPLKSVPADKESKVNTTAELKHHASSFITHASGEALHLYQQMLKKHPNISAQQLKEIISLNQDANFDKINPLDENSLLTMLKETCQNNSGPSKGQCESLINNLTDFLESFCSNKSLGAATAAVIIDVNLKESTTTDLSKDVQLLLKRLYQHFVTKYLSSGLEINSASPAKLLAKNFLQKCKINITQASSNAKDYPLDNSGQKANSPNSPSIKTSNTISHTSFKQSTLPSDITLPPAIEHNQAHNKIDPKFKSGLNNDYNHLQNNKNCGVVGCFIVGKIAERRIQGSYPSFKLNWEDLEKKIKNLAENQFAEITINEFNDKHISYQHKETLKVNEPCPELEKAIRKEVLNYINQSLINQGTNLQLQSQFLNKLEVMTSEISKNPDECIRVVSSGDEEKLATMIARDVLSFKDATKSKSHHVVAEIMNNKPILYNDNYEEFSHRHFTAITYHLVQLNDKIG